MTKSGVEITFTEALETESTLDAQNWDAKWFNVVYSSNYGSDEFYVSDPKKKGREALEIKSVKLSDDKKKVTLEIPGLKPVTNTFIKYKIKGADGAVINQEIAGTINRMP